MSGQSPNNQREKGSGKERPAANDWSPNGWSQQQWGNSSPSASKGSSSNIINSNSQSYSDWNNNSGGWNNNWNNNWNQKVFFYFPGRPSLIFCECRLATINKFNNISD